MPARRGHGEGSIYQRADGRWTASVDFGYHDGKRKRKQIYGDTRKEVSERLKVMLRDQQQGMPAINDRLTLAQFLERWLVDVVRVTTRPRTYRSYSDLARLHIIPALGHLPLSKITAQHIQRLINTKLETLSVRTVQYIRAVLRMAFDQAVKWSMTPRNIVLLVDPPKSERSEMRILSPDQAKQLIAAASSTRLAALYRVALALGLRRGELLGLRWQDVDFENQCLRVEVALQKLSGQAPSLVPPKTASSRRVLPLPFFLIQVLRDHRRRQVEEQMIAGAQWRGAEWNLVFPSSIGTPMTPSNLVRAFHQLLTEAELPQIRFHDLRHSCASILAAEGVSPRVAMEILGHASIATTQNIYTHVLDSSKQQASAAMDRVFGKKEAE